MAEVGVAFVTLAPSMAGFGAKMQKGVGPEVDKVGKSSGKRFGAAMKVGLLAGGAALGGFLKGSLDEAREAQKVGALTNAVIKSTGGIANVTAKDVDKLATAISLKTGVDDEAIAAGQNMLLTFGNVRNEVGKGNDIFNQATVAATDMAAAFGGDAVSNSKMLGKALNDPTAGVSALTRVGVSFTAQQKEQIKTLQASGNILGAQKVILAELSKQTAGAAASQATAGQKAAVAFGNLKEQVGTALLPVIDSMAQAFVNAAPAISSFVGGVGRVGAGVGRVVGLLAPLGPALGKVLGFLVENRGSVAAFAGVILTVAGAMKVASLATAAWSAVLAINPIGAVVVAIAALAAGLVYAYKRSETFRKVVDGAFSAVRAVVAAVVPVLVKVVQAGMQHIHGVFRAVGAALRGDWSGAWNAIRGVAANATGALTGLVRGAFNLLASVAQAAMAKLLEAVRNNFQNAVGLARSLPGLIKGALGSLGSLLYNSGAELIQGLINGITAKIGALKAKIGEVAGAVGRFFPGSPVKEGPLKSWNNGGAGLRLMQMTADGVRKGGKKVREALKASLDAAVTKADELKGVAASFSESVVSSLTKGSLFGSGAAGLRLQLEANRNDAQSMLGALGLAASKGLDGGLSRELAASGDLATAQEIAAMSAAEIDALERLYNDTTTSIKAVADQATAREYGAQVAAQNALIRSLERELKKLAKAVEDGAENGTRKGNAEKDKQTNARARAGR